MTRTFWLSFVNEDGQSLGVCIIDVTDDDAARAKAFAARRFPNAPAGSEWLGAAVRKAHERGCNPGGEVAGVEIDSERVPRSFPRDTLLSRAEAEAASYVS